MPNDFDTSQFPLGSPHPYVLYNNAGNEDLFANDVINEEWTDRPPFNRKRKTIHGMEEQFRRMMEGFGFSRAGVYAAGLIITSHQQYVEVGGQAYVLKSEVPVPYTVTGNWATESVNFKLAGDAILRSDLASGTGAAEIRYASVNLPDIAALKLQRKTQPARYFTLTGYGAPQFYQLDPADSTTVGDDILTVVGNDGGRYKLNHNGWLSVKLGGAKGIGSTFDDTTAFQKTATVAMNNKLGMEVPPPDAFYNVLIGITCNQRLQVRGSIGEAVNIYAGVQGGGSRIHYSGSGDLFAFDTVQDSSLNTIDGSLIDGLMMYGTAAAQNCVRIGKDSDVGDATKVKANMTVRNCYINDFKHGTGIAISWCFSNYLNNNVIQNCGRDIALYYAHATRIDGGNIEQSLVGVDGRISYGVSLYGTVLQGFDQTRQTTYGLKVPATMFVWSGWNGAGTTGASRTTPDDYAGVAIRNLGSKIDVFGSYWEYNNYCWVIETNSISATYGGIVAMDPISKSFVQVGIGGFTDSGVLFQNNGITTAYQGLYQTERNYMAPCDTGGGCDYGTLPANTIYTGPQAHVGVTRRYNAAGYETITREYQTFKGQSQVILDAIAGTVGNFDLFPYAKSNNIRHLYSGATTINYTFVDANGVKAQPGATLSMHLLAIGATTVSFSGTYFACPPITMTAGTQVIVEFFFSNGVWVRKCLPTPFAL